MLGNPLLLGDDGYQISRSVRLRSSASAYFSRTPSVAGNRKTFTISYWLKRGALGSTQYLFAAGSGTTESTWFQGGAFDSNGVSFDSFSAGTWTSTGGATTALFRDPSAWYHIVISVDTTQATAANRCRLYVNGVQQSTSTPTLTQNADLAWNNSGVVHYIGARVDSGPQQFFNGYLAEVNSIDGQALTPSSFGETDAVTGVWKPRRYAGTYGTNGFYLNFSDPSAATAAAIGRDYSGNGNDWTPNNISVSAGATYDSMLDVPTPWADGGNGRGNYAVLNPLSKSSSPTPSNGNLEIAFGGTYPANVLGSIGVSSGKWYWEVLFAGGTAANGHSCGVAVAQWANNNVDPVAGVTTPFYHIVDSRQFFVNSGTQVSNSIAFTAGDIIGVALDVDSNQVSFYKNGTLIASAQSLEANQTWFPFHKNSSFTALTQTANFGQRPFAYTPPSGFRALNTQNLPEPTIVRGNRFFDAVLWTGDGTGTRTISGIGFQPDLVWVKPRSIVENHLLVDAVRGAGDNSNARILTSNNTESETWHSPAFGYLSSFNSNGFTTTAGSTSNGRYNGNGTTYVGWNWREGATQGFDIVTYTGTGAGRTIAHSLGVAPRMMIVKRRDAAAFWPVWHTSIGVNNLNLNLTNALGGDGAALWNSTLPTSSVFSVGTSGDTNANGSNYVAYLFAEVAGFSRFGSYTGNGSTDGPFVFCGFRPRWVMVKCSSSGGAGFSWYIRDAVRDAHNAVSSTVWADSSSAEVANAAYAIDLLSNGFKIRATDSGHNGSGGTYIFAAFAENAFRYSLAR